MYKCCGNFCCEVHIEKAYTHILENISDMLSQKYVTNKRIKFMNKWSAEDFLIFR